MTLGEGVCEGHKLLLGVKVLRPLALGQGEEDTENVVLGLPEAARVVLLVTDPHADTEDVPVLVLATVGVLNNVEEGVEVLLGDTWSALRVANHGE